MKINSIAGQLTLSLKVKLSLCICSLILLCLSTFWFLNRAEVLNITQQQNDALGETLAIQTADSVRELVLSNDLLSLNVVLDQITSNDNIISASVYDVDEQLLATSSASSNSSIVPTSSNQNSINPYYQALIIVQDAIAGSVQLQLDTHRLQASLAKTKIYFWLILVIGFVFAIVSAFAFSAQISAPILEIIKALRNPTANKLELESDRSDEIAELQNTCSEFLEQYQKTLAEQQSLSSIQEEDPSQSNKPVKLMASVLIIKVVNINTAIELLHPSTLSTLLNEYLFYLKKAAKLYGGNVHRFAGDSVMVAFDSRKSGNDFSFNAICCAQLFQMIMTNIAKQHRAASAQSLEFRLAIHSGETFITLATNAQQEIQNEALIGKVIETSYFLSKQSKPGQLVISETTFAQAGGNAKLSTEGSTEITMPDDNVSFMAYILNKEMGNHTPLLEKQCQHILPKS